MRNWLGSAAVTALVAALGVTGASAADLSAAPAYRAMPPPFVAAFDWTGFYIGANIGYGSARVDGSTNGLAGSEDLNGVLGGGQIGYNWQVGNWVLGLEVDGQATGQKATFSVSGGGVTVTEEDSVPWFVTARGRVGYTVAPTWLIYVTGGGAWMDFKSTIGVTGLGSATWEVSHGGWSAGAGIEGAINRNWSWKAEYLHLDTGSFSTTVFNIVPATVRLTDDIGRFGINYRF